LDITIFDGIKNQNYDFIFTKKKIWFFRNVCYGIQLVVVKRAEPFYVFQEYLLESFIANHEYSYNLLAENIHVKIQLAKKQIIYYSVVICCERCMELAQECQNGETPFDFKSLLSHMLNISLKQKV